jgi:hypothetical protein
MHFSFKLPEHWSLDVPDFSSLFITSANGLWDEKTGLTVAPEPWLIILGGENDCVRDDDRLPPFTYEAGHWMTRTCRGGVAVLLGYWDNDPNKEARLGLLKHMLESLHKIR